MYHAGQPAFSYEPQSIYFLAHLYLLFSIPQYTSVSITSIPHQLTTDSMQKLPSPIILDDSLELAEVEALSIASESGNGSLAKRYDQGALLSMSGYEKPQIPDIKGRS